ncbi:phosphoribosyltransferase [uncultured Methanomethylovorans sp.]|uniref:phosphoribosyltransferase n=1 Tax=uncultured Methanomethylovorans sp. TaxID=183759 RepID=UPI00262F174C|nr:phosphoribosyltransferase family protein [uncultured Methanomethylovorans sp.]
MFKNRKDAGKKLAVAIKKYKDNNVLVLAIPRGGVEVGYQVAEYLNADFSILISRKLPFPDDPEAGFGAIAEDGSTFIFNDAALWLSGEQVDHIKQEQINEIKRRIAVLRKGEDLPQMAGRTVILVDDGLAMGSTMRAAIMLCRNRNAGKIVVAVPVAGRRVADEMVRMADELVVLETPRNFMAVAQVYEHWYDVSDVEVLDIMQRRKK